MRIPSVKYQLSLWEVARAHPQNPPFSFMIWRDRFWLKKRIKLLHALNLGEAGTHVSCEDSVHLVWCQNLWKHLSQFQPGQVAEVAFIDIAFFVINMMFSDKFSWAPI